MPTGPDDDEELLLEDLEAELESDAAPGASPDASNGAATPRAAKPPAPPPGLPAIPAWETATVAGAPPFEEAAVEDAQADTALLEVRRPGRPTAPAARRCCSRSRAWPRSRWATARPR
jgi:hypothetical protein